MRLPPVRGLRLTIFLPALAGGAALAAGLLTYVVVGSAAASLALGAGAAAIAAFLALRPLAAMYDESVRHIETGYDRASLFAETGAFARALADEGSAESSLALAGAERERLLAALDTATDAIVAVDSSGNVGLVNAAAEKAFGRKREEAVDHPISWLVPNIDVVQALTESRERGFRVIRSIEGPDRRLLEVTTTRLPGDSGWTLALFHDVTDVRRAEQMRRDFVANVSHELRTPLASIKAVLETLEAGAMSEPAAAGEFIARAETEVDRLTSMMTDLLELSRMESGASGMPEPIDAGKAVTQAAERLRSRAERAEIALTCEVAPGLPEVVADSERIERAVINLIENAIKFTGPGGHIDVRARQQGVSVEIEVSDDGAGIDDRDLPRIFERFYKADNSRRSVGSGLGLALVKHTAEAYGGRVEVESRLGKGSKFTILLPATDRIAAQAAAEARSRP